MIAPDIQKTLTGKAILVAEDDLSLGPRLKELFETAPEATVTLKRCTTGKDNGVLDELLSGIVHYDFWVIDIKLPEDEAALAEVDRLTAELRELNASAQGLPRRQGSYMSDDEEVLHYKIEQVRSELLEVTNRDAGAELLESLVRMRSETKQETNISIPPILFLSSRDDGPMIERAQSVAAKLGVRSAYLTKPVSEQLICDQIRTLLPTSL